jgi:hypothetical protein
MIETEQEMSGNLKLKTSGGCLIEQTYIHCASNGMLAVGRTN